MGKEKKKKRRSSKTSTESDSSSDSSLEKEKLRRLKKKIKREKEKAKKMLKKAKKKKEKRSKSKSKTFSEDESSNKKKKDEATTDIPIELMEMSKVMAPMTKEEWEKKQSVVRRVLDEESGRYRLIKGDGEVIEEIVSRERHKEINKKATMADGEYFKSKTSVNFD